MTIYKQAFFAAVFTFLLLVAFLPKLQAQEYRWGAWTQDPCYRGLQFRARYSDYNDSAKKHHWYIQYKNNYTQKFAFTYELAGTREELAAKIKAGGSYYRTVIKPGAIDSGMWVLTSNQSQIYEVAGQGRLLEPDELDIEGTFRQCDIGGLIGKVDYICNNMPKTAYSCSNYVHPKPAAVIFPKSGYTAASAEDCLEIYEYFSKYRKSDDPAAVKQAIESANALRVRCKLTPDQQTAVDQTVASAQNRLDRIKSNPSQSQSSGDDLLTSIEAVKKVDINGMKDKIVEFFRNHIFQGTLTGQTGSRTAVFSGLQVIFEPQAEFFTVKFHHTMQDRGYPTWRIAEMSGPIKFSSLSSYLTPSNLGGADFYNERSICLEQKGITYLSVYGIDTTSGVSVDVCVPFDFERNPTSFNELVRLVRDFEKGASGGLTETIPGKESDEDEPSPTTPATPIADYEKKVVAEAKSKGITLPSNFLTEGITTPKKTPPTRLTPTQKAAQDTINSQKLSDLIARDAQIITEGVRVVTPAQVRPPVPRPSQKATVTQTIGTTDVSIAYSRPAVKGRRIWGDWPTPVAGEATLDNQNARPAGAPIVPYGHLWRAGANEATLFTVTDDVLINGQPLVAGKYSFHAIPGKEEWTLVFNKDDGQWGSFTYDAAKDALRVKTKPQVVADNQELLSYYIDANEADAGVVTLRWEKIAVPFTVKVKDVVGSTMTKLRTYTTSAKPDDPAPYVNAANYAKANKLTDDAAKWFEAALKASDEQIKAKGSFANYQRRANILVAAGRMQDALAAAEKAVEVGKAEKVDTSALEKRIADIKAGKL